MQSCELRITLVTLFFARWHLELWRGGNHEARGDGINHEARGDGMNHQGWTRTGLFFSHDVVENLRPLPSDENFFRELCGHVQQHNFR